jgi:hypothetical protein
MRETAFEGPNSVNRTSRRVIDGPREHERSSQRRPHPLDGHFRMRSRPKFSPLSGRLTAILRAHLRFRRWTRNSARNNCHFLIRVTGFGSAATPTLLDSSGTCAAQSQSGVPWRASHGDCDRSGNRGRTPGRHLGATNSSLPPVLSLCDSSTRAECHYRRLSRTRSGSRSTTMV